MTISVPFPLSAGDRRFSAVGVMIFAQYYDADQHWLPFINGLVVARPPPTSKQFKKMPYTAKKIAKIIAGSHRIVNKTMFRYVSGVNQLTLPFNEFRKISNKEYNDIEEAKCAGFEQRNDEVATIVYNDNFEQNNGLRGWSVRRKGSIRIEATLVNGS